MKRAVKRLAGALGLQISRVQPRQDPEQWFIDNGSDRDARASILTLPKHSGQCGVRTQRAGSSDDGRLSARISPERSDGRMRVLRGRQYSEVEPTGECITSPARVR